METLVSNNALVGGSTGASPVWRGYGLGPTTELQLQCCRANTDLIPKQLSTVDAVLDKTWMHCEFFVAKYCRPSSLPLPVSLKLTVGRLVLGPVMVAYLQRWSPRGHILKSLASMPQVLENCPVFGSRTALFLNR